MSKTSKNKRRPLVVEGATWQWMASRQSVYVWEPAPSTRRHDLCMDTGCDEDGWCTDPVTPGRVANWIRSHCLGLPTAVVAPRKLPAQMSRPRQPVAAPASQLEAYLLVEQTRMVDCPWDGPEYTNLEVHLDPAVAKQQATLLNARQARLRTLCIELDSQVETLRLRYPGHSKGPGSAEYNDWIRARRLVEQKFLAAHADMPELEARLASGHDVRKTYVVQAQPLYSSVMA